MTESPHDAGTTAYRGFLFADMRGFTAFSERYGNVAAAAMVSRFLEIARGAISRHQGAEMKTEGDLIHAVFPSASSAVLCGLDIVDAAARLNTDEPERPLGLGVGVHAGEAVETAEGYIGRAVNIAARLCAAARPGEVLVSSTVKGIAQASIPVGFIPRGKRRLKGIEDSIIVYAVTRDLSARAPREISRPMLFGGAGVLAVVIIGAAVLVGSRLFGAPAASAPATTGPSAAGTVQPVLIGPLPIGTYRTRAFQPPVTFDVVDLGWTANVEVPEMLGLIRSEAPRGSLFFMRVEQVVENPCIEDGEGAATAPSASDLLAVLRSLPHLTVFESTTVRIGGYVGQQVDVEVLESSLAACGGLAGGDVAVFVAGEEVWRAVPGERFRLIALDVNNEAVTLVMSTDWTDTPSVQELENLNEHGHRLLDRARF